MKIITLLLSIVLVASFNYDTKRYYIVFYEGETDEGRGQGNVTLELNSFPSSKLLKKEIIEASGFDSAHVTATSIFEFKNKADYEAYSR
jgi:hypothetical protein